MDKQVSEAKSAQSPRKASEVAALAHRPWCQGATEGRSLGQSLTPLGFGTV